jgi:transposase
MRDEGYTAMKNYNKETFTYMAIDVAKIALQVQDPDKAFEVKNSPAGFTGLLRRIHALEKTYQLPVLVVCEASGGYERGLLEMLDREGIARALICADRLRAFAKTEGVRAKSDPIDARLLLMFAQEKQLQANVPSEPVLLQLTALVDRRIQLVDQRAREQVRLQNSHKAIHASLNRQIKSIEKEISRIEREIGQLIDSQPKLSSAAEALHDITGVGPVATWSILAYIPELPKISRNRAVSLAGLAPWRKQTGTTESPRHLSGGRAKLRKALYMPTVASIRHNPHISEYYNKRVSEGLPRMSALMACMRKLLIYIRSVLIKNDIQLSYNSSLA